MLSGITAKNNKKKFLDTYGTNLTNKAKNNGIDEVIGREVEIERIIQILNILIMKILIKEINFNFLKEPQCDWHMWFLGKYVKQWLGKN